MKKYMLFIVICLLLTFALINSMNNALTMDTVSKNESVLYEYNEGISYKAYTNKMIDTYIMVSALYLDFKSNTLLPNTDKHPLYVKAKNHFTPYKNHPFIKDFSKYVNYHGQGYIEFKLDRNKAMAATLKNDINKSISVDSHKINFDSIEASPTVTIVKGSIDSIFDLAKEQISGEMFRVDELDLSLIVNGTSYECTGADMSTNMDGMKFEYSFPPLPDTLKSLNFELKSFKANEKVEKNINLRKGVTDTIVNLINKKIVINRVYEKDHETLVTFTSTDDILLSPVTLIVDGKDVSLKNTTTNTREKLSDGTISHTRTMHFPAKGNNLKLYISKIYYTKNYDKKINIPLH
ncbi:hypothetical protein [Anaeromicrobium sediminis]|uniref:Uncharacterized protein n=1 Tax=Anaeromicrobium sediminis TaxID=1478221 RepID=A0A267MNQ0_9FIRM|nr:hypothetical protein [Anaeromicrobium sediminis]PAB61032.1 hypothetical protein CCE28_00960 [Anaeromicrobium sediminis]